MAGLRCRAGRFDERNPHATLPTTTEVIIEELDRDSYVRLWPDGCAWCTKFPPGAGPHAEIPDAIRRVGAASADARRRVLRRRRPPRCARRLRASRCGSLGVSA